MVCVVYLLLFSGGVPGTLDVLLYCVAFWGQDGSYMGNEHVRSLFPELQWYFLAFALRSIHVYARQGQGNTKVDVSKHQGNLQPTSYMKESFIILGAI